MLNFCSEVTKLKPVLYCMYLFFLKARGFSKYFFCGEVFKGEKKVNTFLEKLISSLKNSSQYAFCGKVAIFFDEEKFMFVFKISLF